MLDGLCQYAFNPTEQYQHPEWGSHCGQKTYAGYEETSAPRRQSDGSVKIETELVQREQLDPYCPFHGGTPDPAAPQDRTGDGVEPVIPDPVVDVHPDSVPDSTVKGDLSATD